MAKVVCLVDADEATIESLETQYADTPQVTIQQALLDVEQGQGTFYQYSLPWVSGLTEADEATQRLYPGLRCLKRTQQQTSAIDSLITQCLPDVAQENSENHILLMDLDQQNKTLLWALE